MQAATHVKVWMKAPPEKVFAYVGDLNRHGEWTKAPLKVQGPVPAQAGATYHSESKFMGKPVEADLRVTSYQPSSHIAFDASHKEGTYKHDFTLRAENGGTTVERRIVLPDASPVKGVFLKFLIAPTAVRSDAKKSLGMLKQIVEA